MGKATGQLSLSAMRCRAAAPSRTFASSVSSKQASGGFSVGRIVARLESLQKKHPVAAAREDAPNRRTTRAGTTSASCPSSSSSTPLCLSQEPLRPQEIATSLHFLTSCRGENRSTTADLAAQLLRAWPEDIHHIHAAIENQDDTQVQEVDAPARMKDVIMVLTSLRKLRKQLGTTASEVLNEEVTSSACIRLERTCLEILAKARSMEQPPAAVPSLRSQSMATFGATASGTDPSALGFTAMLRRDVAILLSEFAEVGYFPSELLGHLGRIDFYSPQRNRAGGQRDPGTATQQGSPETSQLVRGRTQSSLMTWVDGRGRNFRRSIDDDFFAVCRPAPGEVVDVGDSGEAAGPRQGVCEVEDTRSLVQLLNASTKLKKLLAESRHQNEELEERENRPPQAHDYHDGCQELQRDRHVFTLARTVARQEIPAYAAAKLGQALNDSMLPIDLSSSAQALAPHLLQEDHTQHSVTGHNSCRTSRKASNAGSIDHTQADDPGGPQDDLTGENKRTLSLALVQRTFTKLLAVSGAQLGLFDEKALANIVNAVAKANRKGEHAFFEFVYNCGLGGGDGGTGGRASKFSEMAIVTLLNACSRLDVRHPLLLDALTRQLPCRPGRFNEAELALLANACSNLGALSPKAKQAPTYQAKDNQNDGAAGGMKDINLLDFLGREILNRTEIKNLRHAALISKAFGRVDWNNAAASSLDEVPLSSIPCSTTAENLEQVQVPAKPSGRSTPDSMVNLRLSIGRIVGDAALRLVPLESTSPSGKHDRGGIRVSSSDLSDLSFSFGLQHAAFDNWFLSVTQKFATQGTGRTSPAAPFFFAPKELSVIAMAVASVGAGDLEFWRAICTTFRNAANRTHVDVASLASWAKALKKMAQRGDPFTGFLEHEILKTCVSSVGERDLAAEENNRQLLPIPNTKNPQDLASLFHTLASTLKSSTPPARAGTRRGRSGMTSSSTSTTSDFEDLCDKISASYIRPLLDCIEAMEPAEFLLVWSGLRHLADAFPFNAGHRTLYIAFLEKARESRKLTDVGEKSRDNRMSVIRLLRDFPPTSVLPEGHAARCKLEEEVASLVSAAPFNNPQMCVDLLEAMARPQDETIGSGASVEGTTMTKSAYSVLRDDVLHYVGAHFEQSYALKTAETLRRGCAVLASLARMGLRNADIEEKARVAFSEASCCSYLESVKRSSSNDLKAFRAAVVDIAEARANLGVFGIAKIAAAAGCTPAAAGLNLSDGGDRATAASFRDVFGSLTTYTSTSCSADRCGRDDVVRQRGDGISSQQFLATLSTKYGNNTRKLATVLSTLALFSPSYWFSLDQRGCLLSHFIGSSRSNLSFFDSSFAASDFEHRQLFLTALDFFQRGKERKHVDEGPVSAGSAVDDARARSSTSSFVGVVDKLPLRAVRSLAEVACGLSLTPSQVAESKQRLRGVARAGRLTAARDIQELLRRMGFARLQVDVPATPYVLQLVLMDFSSWSSTSSSASACEDAEGGNTVFAAGAATAQHRGLVVAAASAPPQDKKGAAPSVTLTCRGAYTEVTSSTRIQPLLNEGISSSTAAPVVVGFGTKTVQRHFSSPSTVRTRVKSSPFVQRQRFAYPEDAARDRAGYSPERDPRPHSVDHLRPSDAFVSLDDGSYYGKGNTKNKDQHKLVTKTNDHDLVEEGPGSFKTRAQMHVDFLRSQGRDLSASSWQFATERALRLLPEATEGDVVNLLEVFAAHGHRDPQFVFQGFARIAEAAKATQWPCEARCAGRANEQVKEYCRLLLALRKLGMRNEEVLKLLPDHEALLAEDDTGVESLSGVGAGGITFAEQGHDRLDEDRASVVTSGGRGGARQEESDTRQEQELQAAVREYRNFLKRSSNC